MSDHGAPDYAHLPPPAPAGRPTTTFYTGLPPRPNASMDWELERNRLTTFFRSLLAFPHAIVAFALQVSTMVVLPIGWVAAVFMGYLPQWAHEYLAKVLGYQMRLSAYTALLTDVYPPFQLSDVSYPIEIELTYAELGRAAVFFRPILVIPAALLGFLLGLASAFPFLLAWLLSVILGRTPRPLYQIHAVTFRYSVRTQAYSMLLSSRYPVGALGERSRYGMESGASHPAPGPRHALYYLTSGARALLVAGFILTASGYGALIALAVHEAKTVTDDTVYMAYEGLADDIATFNTDLEKCLRGSAPIDDCLANPVDALIGTMNDFEAVVNEQTGHSSERAAIVEAVDAFNNELGRLKSASSDSELQASLDALPKDGSDLDEAVLDYTDSL